MHLTPDGRPVFAGGRNAPVGTAFITSASPDHPACPPPQPPLFDLGRENAQVVVGAGGRDECSPYRGSLVLPPCNKMTPTLLPL